MVKCLFMHIFFFNDLLQMLEFQTLNCLNQFQFTVRVGWPYSLKRKAVQGGIERGSWMVCRCTLGQSPSRQWPNPPQHREEMGATVRHQFIIRHERFTVSRFCLLLSLIYFAARWCHCWLHTSQFQCVVWLCEYHRLHSINVKCWHPKITVNGIELLWAFSFSPTQCRLALK